MEKLKYFSFVFLISFLFLFSFKSSAASEISPFPCYNNHNGTIPDDVLNYATQNYGAEYYFYIGPNDGYDQHPFYALKKSSSATICATISGDNFSLFTSGSLSQSDFVMGTIRKNWQGIYVFSAVSGGLNYWWFQNRPSSMVDNTIDYYVNKPVLTGVDSGSLVLSNGLPPTPVPDAGTVPDPSVDLPTFDPTDAPTVPSYTIPSTSGRPTFDINSPIQSVFDIVQWSFDYVFDLIRGVIQNIIDWATFFYNLVIWLFQNWWNFLSYLIEWLYKAFKFLFEPIYNFLNALFVDDDGAISIAEMLYSFIEKFDLFTSTIFQDSFFTTFWNNFTDHLEDALLYFAGVTSFFADLVDLGKVNNEFSFVHLFQVLFIPDPEDLSDLLVSHDIYDVIGLVEDTQTNVNYVKTLITTGDDLYKLTLPEFTLMGVELGPYDIDFSWYLPLKSVGDPIIAAFLIFGFVMYLHTRLPYWLRGQQGDISSLAREVSK